jgi:photosystem II stability/assembly factor-like uncharacterized protein
MAGGPGMVAQPTSAGNNGVYCSDDGAKTWEQRVGPTMNVAVYTLAADPRDFSTMYAGVNGGPCSNPPPVCAPETYFNSTGAIYKTTNSGKTWTFRGEIPSFPESPESSVWVPTDIEWSKQDPNLVYLAGPYARVLKSTDRGANWQQVLSSAALPE